MMEYNAARIRSANDRPENDRGEYVLYWMQMSRRLRANHALDYAVRRANELQKPLVVYEGLKLNYPWASARFHQFILEGMRDNAAAAKQLGLSYWPFVETPKESGHGLVARLCLKACLLVTDDYPQFIVPAQNRAITAQVDIAVHLVDANGIVPLSRLGAPVAAAAHLRPRLHKQFAEAWLHRANHEPELDPAARRGIDPPFSPWSAPANLRAFVAELPVDQAVAPVSTEGGSQAGHRLLAEFVKRKLRRYADERNDPDDPEYGAASGLSAYLHYGHLGIQEVCEAVLSPDWSVGAINPKTRNKDDFFCRDANINGFLDEAITWRDVGYHWHHAQLVSRQAELRAAPTRSWQEPGETPAFNFRSFDFSPRPNGGTLEQILPEWAKKTLAEHHHDRRTHLYRLEEFESASTHDQLWNAAQRELALTGRMHNYLRMLWGKKVLEWSESPETAYQILEHLNNKYALDGRDPNSYTGIFWCFGLFDRPWPGNRPVFGSVRFMSSESTAKKFRLAGYYDYVRRLGGTATPAGRLF